MNRLTAWQHLRLIQVVAPAGYGKTATTAAWVHEQVAPHARVAWISIHGSMNADQWLLLLLETLETHIPALRDLRNHDGPGQFASPQRVRVLCRELAAAERCVLVIDDYHLIDAPAVHAVTQQLLDDAPDALHVVLLTRSAPPLRLTQLILDDALLTLTDADLRLSADEFSAFTHIFHLDELPPAALEAMQQDALGWIAGLKLLAHERRRDLHGQRRSITALTASSLDHFFEVHVLAALNERQRRVLELSARLEYVTPELLAAMTQLPTNECAAVLRSIADAHAFVAEYASPDDRSLSYRLHPLFRSALLRRSEHSTSTAAHDDAVRRAIVWLIRHGEVDSAIALLKDDARAMTNDQARTEIFDALADAMRHALLRYQTSTIQRWLKAIPPAWIATHAPLAVAAGWQTWFITGTDTEKTVASMQLAADAVTALPNESQFDELRMEAQTLQVMRCIIAGDAAAARSHAEAAERMPHAQDSLATAYLNMLQAAFIDADADIELRLQRLQHAGDVCRRIGFGHGVIEMTFAQLLMMWRQCMFERAQAVGAFLQATIAQAGWKYSSLIPDIHYVRGEMYFLIDQIDSARQCLQLGLEHGRADGPTPSSITDLTRVMLEICEAIESPDDSAPHDMDADAHAWADILQHQSPLYQCMAAWPRLLRDLCAGRLESCRQTFETLRITPADLTSATADRIRLAVLAGAVFSGRNDDVIPEKLTEFRDFLRTTQFTLMRLQVEALQALDAQQRGDMPAALRILAELLPEIERTGAVRIVLNMPPLQRALSVCALPFAHQLLKRFPGAREVTHDFGLTPHEHHILADLASNLSPKDIATAHHLSVATVRVHTQRIYRKLHVHSREEAVAKARVLGMLE